MFLKIKSEKENKSQQIDTLIKEMNNFVHDINSHFAITTLTSNNDVQKYHNAFIESNTPIDIGPYAILDMAILNKLNVYFSQSKEVFWKKNVDYSVDTLNFRFTHDVLRRSRKKEKPQDHRFEFIDSDNSLGSGLYGCVYPIASTLCFSEKAILFKNSGQKSTKHPQKIKNRAAKIGYFGFFEQNALVPHLSYKPITEGHLLLGTTRYSLFFLENLDECTKVEGLLSFIKYENQYVLVNETLYHIDTDKGPQKVNIIDYNRFKETLKELNEHNKTKVLSLSIQEIFKLITSNGGHMPIEACLVMNKVSGDALYNIQNKINTIEKKIEFTAQLLEAIEIQLQYISHNDLHSRNVMVDLQTQPMTVNIIDYGEATNSMMHNNFDHIKLLLYEVWGFPKFSTLNLELNEKQLDINQKKLRDFLQQNKNLTLTEFKKIDFELTNQSPNNSCHIF